MSSVTAYGVSMLEMGDKSCIGVAIYCGSPPCQKLQRGHRDVTGGGDICTNGAPALTDRNYIT